MMLSWSHSAKNFTAFLLFFCCIGLPIGRPVVASSKLHRFGVGGTAILCPATSDLDDLDIPYDDESTDLPVGSGHMPGFAFLFEAKTVQATLESGVFEVFPKLSSIRYVNTLNGTIGFISRVDSLRIGSAMRARDLSDEWYQTGLCTHRTALSIVQGKVFEVKCSVGDDYSNILSIAPDRDRPMPKPNSIVIASCNDKYIAFGPFAGTTLHSCRRVFIRSGFIVDYQLQKENLPLYLQIDAFLDAKIGEWRRNCTK